MDVIWYEFVDVSEEPASFIFKVEEEISRLFSVATCIYTLSWIWRIFEVFPFYEVRLHFMSELISNIIPKELFNAVMFYCRHERFLNQK
jgi:hypothetical protein